MEIDAFRQAFFDLTDGWDWEVEGFVDTNGYVYPIDTDTKVISTVFERLASPVIRKICKDHGYIVETANQTTYPDFTMTNSNSKHRVAVDIKTTYKSSTMSFTLGGYNSFIRNNTKNILYPYNSYAEHWIIGFIYKQGDPFQEYDLDAMPKAGDIGCPYKIDHIFIRKKYEISGLRAGSGNTKNIGSVKLKNSADFSAVSGPFLQFSDPHGACDHFWRNYENLIGSISSAQHLYNHPEFEIFK